MTGHDSITPSGRINRCAPWQPSYLLEVGLQRLGRARNRIPVSLCGASSLLISHQSQGLHDGTKMLKQVPWPAADRTDIRPFMWRTALYTVATPSHRP
jgi:hypothetical protein